MKALKRSVEDSLEETSGGDEKRLLEPGRRRANSPVGRRLGITRIPVVIWSLADASLLLTSSRLEVGNMGGAVGDGGTREDGDEKWVTRWRPLTQLLR